MVPSPSVIYWGAKGPSCGLLSIPTNGTTWSTVAGYTAPEITRLVVRDGGTTMAPTPSIWVASADATAANNGVFFLQPAAVAANQSNHMTNAAFPINNWEPTALASDPNDVTKLYAGAGDGSGAYSSTTATASSGTGAGGSFSAFKTGLGNVAVKFLTRDTSNTTDFFAAGDQFGVATSLNTGATTTWAVQTLTGCTSPVSSFAYDTPGTTALATCQGVQGVFVGTAKGTTWTLPVHRARTPARPSLPSLQRCPPR